MCIVPRPYRASRPYVAELGKVPGSPDQHSDVDRHPDNETVAGVDILRIEGGLFFANAEAVASTLRARSKQPGVRAIILDAETIPFVDISAVNTLAGVTGDLKALGVDLVLAHDIGQVRDLFRVARADHLVDNVDPTVQLAVDALAPTEGGET